MNQFKSKNRLARLKLSSALSASKLALVLAQGAQAQDVDPEEDEVVATGTRQVIQDSIALKRNNTQIVDGLSADEIGDIPASSIGEALENITGVTSHRENGGATEVSIRGLGPYLSSTVVNGRAATNGSGDRSVNFSQFPSELINKLAVFKAQDASQIEGGVAGQIQLETLRLLDFGHRRLQFEAKANVNPDQLNQSDTQVGDFGHRLTGSYTDQFEVGGGDFGISIGVQTSDISQPEAESRQTSSSSNSRVACLITDGLAQYTDQTNGGTFTGFSNNPETRDRGDDDCDDFNDRRNPANLTTRGSDTEGYDTTIDPATGLAIDNGTPFVFAPSQRHFRQNDTRDQRDQRDAIFGTLQWEPNDQWSINVDGQWLERTQSELRNDLTFNGGRRNDTSLNVGPGGTDSGDPFNINRGRFSFEIGDNTDLNINNRQVVDGSGSAATGDASAWVDIIASTNQACRTQFAEDNFLGSVRSGNLVTNIADDGAILSETNSWATFDAQCVAETAVDSRNSILDQINLAIADRGDVDDPLSLLSASIPELLRESASTIDVKETTTAFYAMTNYETAFNGMPLSGNLGVRIVQTDVEATGFRPEITVTNTSGELSATLGNLVPVTVENDYTEILPSATAILELKDDKLLRFGVFRAMSRADPVDVGFGRTIAVENDDENPPTTLDELIGDTVRADGNPELDPLMSWNFDARFEWYLNDDSILAVGAYYKSFQGGFINTRQSEDYIIDGETVTREVSVQQTSDETRDLFGIELTAAHTMSYLPGLLSGLGGKLSYNYVDSNFEFEDRRYGDAFQVQTDGSIVQLRQGIIAPGGLPGLSDHTLSAQVYCQIGELDLQVNYKYRDGYFQPFISDGSVLRFIEDVGVWEARASYNISENFRLSAEIINIFSEPKEQAAFVTDDIYEVNDYGPRTFFGLRGRV